MRPFCIPIRAVFYRVDDIYFAHCLETDLAGDGDSLIAALGELSEAVRLQIEAGVEHHNMANLFQPADARFFVMYAAGKDAVTGVVELEKISADWRAGRAN